MLKSSNPNGVFSSYQSMDVVIRHSAFSCSRFVRSKDLCFWIELIQTSIFSTNPKIPVFIFVNFSYCTPANRVLIVLGEILFKLCVLFLMVIDAAKISSYPNSIFFINRNRISRIIRNAKRIIKIFFEIRVFFGFDIINKHTRFAGYPNFICSIFFELAHKQRLFCRKRQHGCTLANAIIGEHTIFLCTY